LGSLSFFGEPQVSIKYGIVRKISININFLDPLIKRESRKGGSSGEE
jgi:hypothetical protein